jgi:histone H3/H4
MAKRQNIIPYEPVGRIIEATGVERVSHDAKVALADYLTEYALKLGKLAVKYASHAGRTTVSDKDIKLAEKYLE